MAERVGKIGLNAGTPWSLFAENTAFEDTEGIHLFVASMLSVRPCCLLMHNGLYPN